MPFDPSAAAALLLQHNKILVTAHTNPDGDALGSMCAFARLCQLMGKEVRMACQSKVPDFLKWLELPAPLLHSYAELSGWEPELAVFLDCGVPERSGPDGFALATGQGLSGWDKVQILNIDHHIGNPNFGHVNYVETEAGATAELVGLIVEHFGYGLSGKIGEAIYLGLSSDTGNFTYSNTSPHLFAMAARIVDNGLKVEEFIQKSENNWSIGRMQLWGHLLLHLNVYAGGKIVSTVITNNLLKKFECKAGDLEGFVSFLRHLHSAEVSVLVREKVSVGSKISLRSMGGENSFDVQKTASVFGGGGHKAASGAELALPPDEAEKAVVDELLKTLQ